MQFQVPQFLDVEDKIIGPFTLKQFLYLAGGLGSAYLSYRFIPWLGAILGVGFITLGGALAFYKFNNKPFIFIIESAVNYFRGDRFYIWRRKEKTEEAKLNLNNFTPTTHTPTASMKTVSSKLSDLAWSMDVPKTVLPDRMTAVVADQRHADELGL